MHSVHVYIMHTLAHLSCMISLGTILVAVGDLAVMKITYLESKTSYTVCKALGSVLCC